MAMAKPPKVRVFNVTPKRSRTMTAANKERGIEAKEMKAVRQSRRKKNRMMATRTPPIANDSLTLCSEASMKLAGRNSRGYTVIFSEAKAGANSSSAASTARVTSIVLAPY